MATRLTTYVRLRDTHITGEIYSRFEQDGETFYYVLWDESSGGSPELHRENELMPSEKKISYPSPKYLMSDWADRKRQEDDREHTQGLSFGSPTRGHPCQRR